MNKKEFPTLAEAELFVEPLLTEKKWLIDVQQEDETSPVIVSWREHMMYTAQDGKEYHDEVWRTEKGELLHIQELSEEHCRNVLRMLLREERRVADLLSGFGNELVNGEVTEFTKSEDELEDIGAAYQVPGSNLLH